MLILIFHRNNSFASQTNLCSGLSSRINLTQYISVKCLNLRLTAKYCCCEWNSDCCVNIHALPFISWF